jgi:hypothetical protein
MLAVFVSLPKPSKGEKAHKMHVRSSGRSVNSKTATLPDETSNTFETDWRLFPFDSCPSTKVPLMRPALQTLWRNFANATRRTTLAELPYRILFERDAEKNRH